MNIIEKKLQEFREKFGVNLWRQGENKEFISCPAEIEAFLSSALKEVQEETIKDFCRCKDCPVNEDLLNRLKKK